MEICAAYCEINKQREREKNKTRRGDNTNKVNKQ